MNLQRYNKFWVALVPMIALLITQFTGEAVTEDQVREWGELAIIVVTPFLVYLVPNKDA